MTHVLSPADEKTRLEAIRRRHHEASTDWSFSVTSHGETISGRVIPTEDAAPITYLAPESGYADRDFLLAAHRDIAFLLRLVDRAVKAMRSINQRQDQERRAKDYATEAAMKCAEPAFQRFVAERFELEQPLDEKRVAGRLRSVLKISSRSELNINPAAAAAWKDLRSAYDAWRRQ